MEIIYTSGSRLVPCLKLAIIAEANIHFLHSLPSLGDCSVHETFQVPEGKKIQYHKRNKKLLRFFFS